MKHKGRRELTDQVHSAVQSRRLNELLRLQSDAGSQCNDGAPSHRGGQQSTQSGVCRGIETDQPAGQALVDCAGRRSNSFSSNTSRPKQTWWFLTCGGSCRIGENTYDV